jgi:hypothetical protein
VCCGRATLFRSRGGLRLHAHNRLPSRESRRERSRDRLRRRPSESEIRPDRQQLLGLRSSELNRRVRRNRNVSRALRLLHREKVEGTAGRAKRRRRFELEHSPATIQSGVALRLPPHSKARNRPAKGGGKSRLVSAVAYSSTIESSFGRRIGAGAGVGSLARGGSSTKVSSPRVCGQKSQ